MPEAGPLPYYMQETKDSITLGKKIKEIWAAFRTTGGLLFFIDPTVPRTKKLPIMDIIIVAGTLSQNKRSCCPDNSEQQLLFLLRD